MGGVRTCIVFFVILTFVDFYHCGRGGGSQDYEIQSTVSADDAWARPLDALALRTTARARSTTRRTTPRPTTRRTTPRPMTRRTTPRPTTRRTTPRPVVMPRHETTRRTTPRQTTKRTTPRPVVTPKPDWYPNRETTRRTTLRSTTKRTTPRPVVTPKPTAPRPRPTPRRTTPRPVTKKVIYDEGIPPVPGKGPKHGKTKIVIKNEYNYHYPGFYTVPVAHHQYPGYYQTYSSYRYTPSDTGSGILGFYIGYKLGRLTTPTYTHESFFEGYRPRYDHYTIHHYYHNDNTLQQRPRIASNTIVGCVGDSSGICPANTTSLCTSDGTLMCVVPATSLTTCLNAQKQPVSCLKSTFSCVNNTDPECSNKDEVVVDIPCISTTRVDGDIKYVNNTVVQQEPDSTNNCTRTISCLNDPRPECINKTSNLVNAACDDGTINCTRVISCSNNTTTQQPNVTCILYANGTCNLQTGMTYLNSTTNCTGIISCVNNTSPECLNKTDISTNITCIPSVNCTVFTNGTCNLHTGMTYLNNPLMEGTNSTQYPMNTTSPHWIWKRSVPTAQDFCVAVVAEPAPRVPTEGEGFLSDARSIFRKFVEAAWDL